MTCCKAVLAVENLNTDNRTNISRMHELTRLVHLTSVERGIGRSRKSKVDPVDRDRSE